MQLHLFSELAFSANTLQPKWCHSVQSLAQQKTTYDAHDFRRKSLHISIHCCKSECCLCAVVGGQEEEVCETKGCRIAPGHGCPTSSLRARRRGNAFGNTIPVPTGIHTNSLLEKSERWGIYKQRPACVSGIAFKAVVSTYHAVYPARAKQPPANMQRMVLHPLLFNHLQNSCTCYHFGQKQRTLQVMAHTFLMSFSGWEESQSKMQKRTRALETSEQPFTCTKWRGRESLRVYCKEIKWIWILDTKSTTGSEGTNGLRY